MLVFYTKTINLKCDIYITFDVDLPVWIEQLCCSGASVDSTPCYWHTYITLLARPELAPASTHLPCCAETTNPAWQQP